MRAARLVVLLAVLAAVAGCGGGSDEPALEARSLVLRANDLPRGFAIDETVTGPVSNEEVARSRAPGYEQRLEGWGRIEGFSRQLRRRKKVAGPLGAVDGANSVASVYEREEGAAESFASGVRDYASTGFVPAGKLDVGDEARSFRGESTLAGRRVEYVVATWRTGRVIASLVVEGRPGRVRLSIVQGLARKQDARIRSAAP